MTALPFCVPEVSALWWRCASFFCQGKQQNAISIARAIPDIKEQWRVLLHVVISCLLVKWSDLLIRFQLNWLNSIEGTFWKDHVGLQWVSLIQLLIFLLPIPSVLNLVGALPLALLGWVLHLFCFMNTAWKATSHHTSSRLAFPRQNL